MAKKQTKTDPLHLTNNTTSFGLPIVLEQGQSLDDYLKLRDTWYEKLKNSGFSELERFNRYNPALVEPYTNKPLPSSPDKDLNSLSAGYFAALECFIARVHISQDCAEAPLHNFFKRKTNYELIKLVASGLSYHELSRLLCEKYTKKHSEAGISKSFYKHMKGSSVALLFQRARNLHPYIYYYLIWHGFLDLNDVGYYNWVGLNRLDTRLNIESLAQKLGQKAPRWVYPVSKVRLRKD